jgi:hypothetical protein
MIVLDVLLKLFPRGDRVHIEANYEFSKFPGLKATEIMGIAIMYAAMDV